MNKTKLTLKRCDVVLVLFPNSDLKTAKTRPAVIIQADNLNTGLSQVIIAMITSNMSRANHPSRVTILLNSLLGKNSGLLSDSVVMTDNLATVETAAIYRIIGYLPDEKIDKALKYTLSLS
ncbi:type II toxin-antitoxin system PemK/MazF family toxin [Cyanothece sp. BG0011]|uniref:type II toxin-antitoxin system PemK/MazF family toxin n=1 Tax=Cyanothece sp. BG0011 TaxID=2082950 RepID=UPI0018E5A914|nr:type II toxin-antitoxin system PemK/MazF family toxin [Cyanothece sp. BG0011]